MSEIAVIGGGIGGLVAGIALQRAGKAVRIYERAPAFAEVGAGISISPNATLGLESLGLGDFMQAQANEPLEQVQFHGLTGERLTASDRRTTRQTYGAAYYQLHRADLHHELVRVFGLDNCAMDHELNGIAGDLNGVTLNFTDRDPVRVDVAIAADGLRSVVRDIVFDPAPPVFSGHVAWRALIPAERLGGDYTLRRSTNHIAGQNLVTYPVRGTTFVNVVALTRSSVWSEESWSAKAEKAELAAQFEGWDGFVRHAIDAIPEEQLYRWGLFLREPLTRWVAGHVALLGDAAHPMLPYMGQGASCAIEDGVVLGRCFAQCADPDSALALYERSRIDRASLLQRESNLGGERLQAFNPDLLRDMPLRNEDALGIFAYDPASVSLG